MKLTKAEQTWVKKVNKILSECPSDRLGFFTTGDPTIGIFDVRKLSEIGDLMDRRIAVDFGPACRKLNAIADETIDFPECVESTAG